MFEWLGWSYRGPLPRSRATATVTRRRGSGKFVVAFNRRWGGYAFPTRPFSPTPGLSVREQRAEACRAARRAFRDDVGPALGESAAHWMDQFEVAGTSGRTRTRALYVYEVCVVDPAGAVPQGPFGGLVGLLSRKEILDSAPHEPGDQQRCVTWTTWRVLHDLLERQHAAAAVVCRRVGGTREFLMTLNRDLRWFFPARRMAADDDPRRVVALEFTVGAGLLGGLQVEDGLTFDVTQATGPLGQRDYTFHLHPVRFALDPVAHGDRVRDALGRPGQAEWVSETLFASPLVSDTAQQLLPYAQRLCPN
jgi:hypothetical protein